MTDWVPPDAAGTQGSAHRSAREPDRDFERGILRQLVHHREMESAILESYREIAGRSSSGEAVRFLVQMLLEDEQRHHQLFDKMANGMRSILWEIPVEPRLPPMQTRADPELLEETKRLLAFEKQDAKELRALRKDLRGSGTSSVDPLMVELMLHDTAKHIAILEYIKAHLKR
jgi:hypothetical protein